MTDSRLLEQDLTPSFNVDGAPPTPGPTRLGYRQAYYYLVNVEEHPEILPWAYDLVMARLAAVPHNAIDELPTSLPDALDRISTQPQHPWRQAMDDLTRRQVLHYFTQYMPAAFVDGCWLQCGVRVSAAHTLLGALLMDLYAHQVRAYIADPGTHFVADYRAAYGRLGAPLEEVGSQSFAERKDIRDSSFVLPVLLLSMAQFARTLPAEILGLNLAWQFLGLSAFGPTLIRDLCGAYALPPLGNDMDEVGHLERGREKARQAAVRYLEAADPSRREELRARLVRGMLAARESWNEWSVRTAGSAPVGPPDPRQEMLDLVWRKAPHATGYHADKKLGSRRIDEHLDPMAFDGPALLEELSRSRWVKPGQSGKSGILRHLVKFGGPMLAVFSPVELRIIQNWIDSLPPPKSASVESAPQDSSAPSPPASAVSPVPAGPTTGEEEYAVGRGWSVSQFRKRSEQLFGNCTVRELFYYLINVELYPDILPIAERYARDRLERSMAMLWKGERPIPSRRYDPDALERWVYKKHREQVDSYRPPAVRPPVPKDAFVEVSVQLAPIILIDGGWLQGVATSAIIHTVIGRMLFHVLVEEIGAGNLEEHHANIYRKLLAAMGEEAPPVESWEFARWPRLKDSSFDVPTLWLSISCFPRHFLPEILGLNLAVELAGIGGPYMEARDTLKRFGLPTLFVDVHNAADNVAAGHSAWAMNAIKRYMDEVAERQGPHNLDHTWHRVWSGVRATLPQIGRLRLIAHRIRRRFSAQDPSAVPLIFPS